MAERFKALVLKINRKVNNLMSSNLILPEFVYASQQYFFVEISHNSLIGKAIDL